MSERTADRRLVLRRLGQAGAVLGAAGALGGLGLLGRGRFQGGGADGSRATCACPTSPAAPPRRGAGERPRPCRARGARRARRMGRFVKRGETVLVKPNMAWDRTPEQGANTHRTWWRRSCASAGTRGRAG